MGKGTFNGGGTLLSRSGSYLSFDPAAPQKTTPKKTTPKKTTPEKKIPKKKIPTKKIPKAVLKRLQKPQALTKQGLKKKTREQRRARQKKRESKKRTEALVLYQQSLSGYARNCRISDLQGKPWPEPAKLIRIHLDDDKQEIHREVVNHSSYGVDSNTRKLWSDQRTIRFAKQCAIADFVGIRRPIPPIELQQLYTDKKVADFLLDLKFYPVFRQTTKILISERKAIDRDGKRKTPDAKTKYP
ncbi:MAG: hypothetical protein K8F25_18420 [Fimbriimonadaceae bacterium]|nr:hypothetical protein [Alphaproteobacteria bacterium]